MEISFGSRNHFINWFGTAMFRSTGEQCSRSQVETRLKNLEKSGAITTRRTDDGRLMLCVNDSKALC
ncbi:hypothetical protein LHK_01670 [Laribacter hongkongensis HLHK9]|uniref:Uncharacterized protein n=1 Tax=Laribacter hongkongensis (strain HLHK9) TaxID=557598 RepID=C1D865_LARHH|nr:hypothetical protein [Laribacter hongkongensis]ACO74655.1 hypothetical protein LHK_01670 [Laribacter hongkongensis HLHK9]